MEKSSQIAWKIVPHRPFFPLKLVPLIEVLLYNRFSLFQLGGTSEGESRSSNGPGGGSPRQKGKWGKLFSKRRNSPQELRPGAPSGAKRSSSPAKKATPPPGNLSRLGLEPNLHCHLAQCGRAHDCQAKDRRFDSGPNSSVCTLLAPGFENTWGGILG
jgi:hypothetical protein